MKLIDRIAYKVAEKNFTAIFKLSSYYDTKFWADTMNDALNDAGLKWTDIVEAFENMNKAKIEGRCFPFYDSGDPAVVQIWDIMCGTFKINQACLIAERERKQRSRA